MSFSPYSYKPVIDNDLKLYNEHKDGVEQEIRSKHGVSNDFELVPVTYLLRPGHGLDKTYKVALPNDQYVNVRFMAGDIVRPGESRPKVSFRVGDTLSSSPDNDN